MDEHLLLKVWSVDKQLKLHRKLVRNIRSQVPLGPTESESTFTWVKIWEDLVTLNSSGL